MHPALSVICFTVLSGAGYGLFSLLLLGYLLGVAPLQEAAVLKSGVVLTFILVSAGLLSSTLHLANPKNAWRAVCRFKTSWLSREAVFALAFYPFFLLFGLGAFQSGAEMSGFFKLMGIIALVMALATVFSQSMIYASLKTIRQWNTALTPVNYLALGLMCGAVILLAIQSLAGDMEAGVLVALTLGLLVVGAVVKLTYLFWIGKPAGSTIQTATGFTQASVRLLDQGHTSNGFLNNEFGYKVAAQKLLNLRYAAIGLAFALPFLLVASAGSSLALLAAVSVLAGLLVERWLFFAEARHVVNLFHGDQRT